jgi:uncharacterized damage-inducible protein DinB
MEITMNDTLLYFSRHNVWATKTLLGSCRTLSPAQLTRPGDAAYGSIIQTLNHVVTSDGAFLSSLGGPQASWVAETERELAKYPEPWSNEDAREPIVGLDVGLDELAVRVDEAERLWDAFFAAEEFDPERESVLDLGTYECRTGIVMAQVFHHGSVHREQVCAMLTRLGIEPPDLQPWALADATGLSRFVGGRTS